MCWQLLSNISTGLLTLSAALGGTYLQSHLVNNKDQLLQKQKDIKEAYSLLDEIPDLFIPDYLNCKNKIDRKPMLEYSNKTNLDQTDVIRKINLLIISSYIELENKIKDLRTIVCAYQLYLHEVLLNKTGITMEEFNKKSKSHQNKVLEKVVDIQKELRGRLQI